MKFLPWVRTDEEREQADRDARAVADARSHIRILVHELAKITEKVEQKVGRA